MPTEPAANQHLTAATIRAAGTVPWRVDRGELEVALVHRPSYDDWAWAKGKLDPGESSVVAAGRETREETGLAVVLGQPLPVSHYTVLDRVGARTAKQVEYWASRVVGGTGLLEHEIDEVRWTGVTEAHDLLDYSRDRDQLAAIVRFHQSGTLDTWPLILVRHARAVPREGWRGDDPDRPLLPVGRAKADSLVGLLTAFGPQRVISSPATRCVATIAPFARAAGLEVLTREGLSEEGFALHPHKAPRHIRRLLHRGEPVVVCGHGPVLPAMVQALEQACVNERVAHVLGRFPMAKGEVMVAHVARSGEVVAAERHTV